MDQVKIGRFIAEKRREQGLTQMQLAEALGITDRAVSKWETGKSLPDASIMLELCRLLKITVNDLLNGEVVSMERYNEAMENHLLEMVKQKETKDRQLLRMEIVLSAVSLLFLFAMIAVGAVFMKQGQPKRIFFLLLGIGLFQFLVCGLFALRIEQTAGCYVCAECGHRYVSSFAAVTFAMHMNRTRYLRCPACGKRSWQKKALSKE
ncbi:MAG: helix-turn-helix domain-containing protein [Clostridia bacterium]|nr:helix-turn-helix domain-containing protein [Clostridia bacterium]